MFSALIMPVLTAAHHNVMPTEGFSAAHGCLHQFGTVLSSAHKAWQQLRDSLVLHGFRGEYVVGRTQEAILRGAGDGGTVVDFMGALAADVRNVPRTPSAPPTTQRDAPAPALRPPRVRRDVSRRLPRVVELEFSPTARLPMSSSSSDAPSETMRGGRLSQRLISQRSRSAHAEQAAENAVAARRLLGQ
jgi:hypothetical protein